MTIFNPEQLINIHQTINDDNGKIESTKINIGSTGSISIKDAEFFLKTLESKIDRAKELEKLT